MQLPNRCAQFDNDYVDFKNNLATLQAQVQAFADSFFDKPLSVEQQLALLSRLATIGKGALDFSDKYSRVLLNFARELEQLKRFYQKTKTEPTVARNVPPVAGKVCTYRHNAVLSD